MHIRNNAQTAACLNAEAAVVGAHAESLRVLALMATPPGLLTLFAEVTSSWHFHQMARTLRRVQSGIAHRGCLQCGQLQACPEAGRMIESVRRCLRSIDETITQVLSVPFAGRLLRRACSGLSKEAVELAELVEDIEILQAVPVDGGSGEDNLSWESVKADLKL